MNVHGCDCSIVIKTAYSEIDIPYSNETIREAISFLQEEAAIEGDGVCRGLSKSNGITGCIVTPLTISTVPLLLHLAMGSSDIPVFVSETRNLYRHSLSLLPFEDSPCFDLVQARGDGKWLYENCGVKGFELRIQKEETIQLKLDIAGEQVPVNYPYNEKTKKEDGELYRGDGVKYKINGKEYQNIYGIILNSRKNEGTKTELWIKRSLESGPDIPHLIDELAITAQLFREKYEFRHFGMFRLTLTHLVLTSNETTINSPDTVIGPIRYYVAGTVIAEVFSFGEGKME
jgi:hypothetical protein